MARAQYLGLGGDFLTRRAAEALAGGERAGRLGSAPARMGGGLAGAPRLIAAHRRENAARRAQLARVAGDPEALVSGLFRGFGGRRGWGEA